MEAEVKKWINILVTAFVLIMAVPAVSQAAEKAGGTLTAAGNNVAVTVTLPEGRTEAITTLRLQLRVSVGSGTMDKPAFTFDPAVKSAVRDADIRKEKDNSYTIDIILSGKKDQRIFQTNGTVKIGTVSLKPASAAFAATVAFAGKNGAASAPTVDYVDSSGLSAITVPLAGTKPAEVKKAAAQTFSSAKPKLTVSVKNGSRRVRFGWKKVSGASGYLIYQYNTKTKKYKRIKTITGEKKLSWSKDFSWGTKYTFKLRAFQTMPGGGKTYGKYSPAVKSVVPPSGVKKFSAEFWSVGKAGLLWKRVPKAGGYQIYRSAKKKGKYKLARTIRKGKTTRCTSIKHKKGKTYYYKIRAYIKPAGKKRVYSKFSAVKKYKNTGKRKR